MTGSLPGTVRYVVYRSRWRVGGAWRWRALAANNRVIATSGEGYHHRSDCIDAINLLRTSEVMVEVRP